MAALITDLKRRGLLDSTIVLWGGEFGRSPESQGSKGRDHHALGFTMYLAGGGIIGHPDGIAAGVNSMREAWEAAMQGVDLHAYARTHPALQKALSHFAGR